MLAQAYNEPVPQKRRAGKRQQKPPKRPNMRENLTGHDKRLPAAEVL